MFAGSAKFHFDILLADSKTTAFYVASFHPYFCSSLVMPLKLEWNGLLHWSRLELL
jgi:hypothetical protein